MADYDNIEYDNEYADYTNEYADNDNYQDQGISEYNHLNKKVSYKVIVDDEVLKLREDFIKIAALRLDLERQSLILALVYFRWNVDWLAEKWYDNPEKYSEEAGISLSTKSAGILKKQGVKPNNNECSVCYTSKDDLEDSSDFISLPCKHFFCKDCWREYLNEKLNEIHTVIITSCPQVGCNCIVTEETFKQVLEKNDNSNYAKYIKAVIKNFTDFNSVVKSCPSPGCETFINCNQSGNKEVECTLCNNRFCFKCLQNGHKPCTCDMITIWDSKNKSESENVKWLEVNTKKCPACHKHIEKNQGCNHMTCQKVAGGCGYEFCWLCMGKWAGHSACNKYNDNEKKKNEIKHDLDRYIHFFDRYMNHKKSLDFAIKMKPQLDTLIEAFNELKSISYMDLLFLKEGSKTIINSKRVLMNSYIFGFYLKKNSKHIPLFEFHQSMLETYADKLQGFLEKNSLKALFALEIHQEFIDNFTLIKNQIVDLYSATNNFLENLVSNIENSMLNELDYKSMK